MHPVPAPEPVGGARRHRCRHLDDPMEDARFDAAARVPPGTFPVLLSPEGLAVAGRRLDGHARVDLDPAWTRRSGGADGAEVLLLQGRPIGEPVAH